MRPDNLRRDTAHTRPSDPTSARTKFFFVIYGSNNPIGPLRYRTDALYRVPHTLQQLATIFQKLLVNKVVKRAVCGTAATAAWIFGGDGDAAPLRWGSSKNYIQCHSLPISSHPLEPAQRLSKIAPWQPKGSRSRRRRVASCTRSQRGQRAAAVVPQRTRQRSSASQSTLHRDGAAAATRIVRGDGPRRRRGRDASSCTAARARSSSTDRRPIDAPQASSTGVGADVAPRSGAAAATAP